MTLKHLRTDLIVDTFSALLFDVCRNCSVCISHFSAPWHCVAFEIFSKAEQQRPLLHSAGSHPQKKEMGHSPI